MSHKQFKNLKVWITILSFIFAIVMKSDIDWSNLQNNYVDWHRVKEICYDLSVGVFSAMILVWFIDEIGNKIEEKKSIEKEKAIIIRFDKVLQRYIEQYTLNFYCVVTPLLERKFENVTMPENFTLKDMRDLYEPSLLRNEKFSTGSVESFLRIEHELRKELISLSEKYDFEFYPVFSDIFLKYIQISLAYDRQTVILDAINKPFDEKRMMTDFIRELLENHADEYYQKMLQGENIGSNAVDPYILLYRMMKLERSLILQYQDEIRKLS